MINAGIYVLSPAAFDALVPGQATDMPQLLDALIAQGHRVALYEVGDYWCDIGQKQDLERARGEFATYFS
ncbi:MAG: hypothetical protein FJX65_11885 [Alphaproteobacteria bacterium]|nr:hypothetical protein [Alphaproteobacteria bacterium]